MAYDDRDIDDIKRRVDKIEQDARLAANWKNKNDLDMQKIDLQNQQTNKELSKLNSYVSKLIWSIIAISVAAVARFIFAGGLNAP